MTNAISANGLALIQEYEGFQPEPRQLPDGAWVVGFSHVRVGEPGSAVNQNEAAEVLALDLAPFENLVNARVTVPLTQSQFDALVSFAFSVGAEAFENSQVLRRMNAGDTLAAACAMDAWRKGEVGGELTVVDALVRRRAAEKALFLKELPQQSAPSVFMRAKLDHAASILGAPVAYTSAPEVGSVPVVQPKPEPTQRLTEILNSEPATEALLLTHVVPDDVSEDEIVTAHAKPVARALENAREAARADFEVKEARRKQKQGFPFFQKEAPSKIEPALNFEVDRRIHKLRTQRPAPRVPLPKVKIGVSFETVGLGALLVFGIGLIATGGSLLVDGVYDFVNVAAAAALVTPGLFATLIAAVGLWRPHSKPVEA